MASTQPTAHLRGHYHTVDPNYGSPPNGGKHVFVPSSPIYSIQLSLGFLPGGSREWEIADSRGSLLLLYRGLQLPTTFNEHQAAGSRSLHSPALVVCEPGTQRYKRIPCPEPEDLEGHRYLGLFLLDAGETSHQSGRGGSGGHLSLSNFRVMAALLRPHACEAGRGVPVSYVLSNSTGSDDVETAWSSSVFSSSSSSRSGAGGWHVVKRAWSGQGIHVPDTVESFYFAGRANVSLYWGIQGAGAGASTALVLDEATAAFSTVTLPESTRGSYERCSFRVIGGKDGGALRVVRAMDNNDLKVFSRLHGSGSDEWAVEGLVRLPEATRGLPGREDGYFQDRQAVVIDAHEEYVLLTPREKTWVFSVVLETMEVDRAHERNKYAGPAYPCECERRWLWAPISSAIAGEPTWGPRSVTTTVSRARNGGVVVASTYARGPGLLQLI